MTRYGEWEDTPQAIRNPNGDQSGLNERLIDKESGENDASYSERSEVQKRSCNDVIFAIIFWAMVIGVSVLAGTKGVDQAIKDSIPHAELSFRGLMFYLMSTLAVSLGFSGLVLVVLECCTHHIIATTLLFSVVVSLILAIECCIIKNIIGAVLGFFVAGFVLCYYFLVRSRIPFGTANMQTGSAATRSNAGIFFIGYLFVLLNIGFLFIWAIALFGLIHGDTKCDSGGKCHTSVNFGLIFLMIVSVLFAQQVFKNCAHATVAGVVGTWWFFPEEAKSCCSPAVRRSIFRTLTTSFGSICFGSLLVNIIHALKVLVEPLRPKNDSDSCCHCCLDCIVSSIEDIADYFNKYAFVYVGLYGYSFLDAGKNVTTLFDLRGFSVITNDHLVTNVMNILTLSMALISAGIGILIDKAQPSWLMLFHNNEDSFALRDGNPTVNQLPAFLLSLLAGVIVSETLFGIIDSAVNTVIVLFAEAPAEFTRNHPEHSSNMREAWRQVYDFEP